MALAAAQRVTDAGVAPTYATPTATDKFVWPEGAAYVLMHVKNANGANCNIAITSRAPASDGLVVTNKAVVVPLTTGDRMIRISPAYRDVDGDVDMTFDVQTSVSVAVLYY